MALLCISQVWPWIQSAGVDSGRILHFFLELELESKISEKQDLDPGSIYIFSSSRSLCGLYKCHW